MTSYSVADMALIEAAHLLDPLRTLNTSGEVIFFLRQLGYTVPLANLVDVFTEVASKTDQVVTDAIKLLNAGTDEEKLEALLPLLHSVAAALDEIIKVEPALRSAPGLAQKFIDNAPLDQLPIRLLDFLLYQHLYRRYPKIFGVLHLMGILEEEALNEVSTICQPAIRLKVVRWKRLPRYLSEPGTVIDEVYTWNTSFNSDEFFNRFSIFLRAMAVAGGIYRQSDNVKTALGNTTANLNEFRIPIFSSGIYPDAYAQFGLNLTPAEATIEKKKGLAFIPYLTGTGSFGFQFSEHWEAVLQASLNLDAGIGLIVRPPISVEFLQNLFTAPQKAASLGAALTVQQKSGAGNQPKTFYLFGSQATTHLSVSGMSVKFFGNLNSPGDDAGVEVEIKNIHLLFTSGEGDSFLAKTLPNSGIESTFSLGIGFSVARALYFKGSVTIIILLPTHIQLGPVDIQGIRVAVGLKADQTIPVEVSANIKAELGPIVMVVENVGISSTFSFPPERNGQLGPVDFRLGFKPPNGLGMALDTGPVVGGGYIRFDPENEQYDGILQLEIQDTISIKAIVLLTTRVPGLPPGVKGFSLLVILTAEFPPIQLGYGFALLGVGGLFGANRTMLLDPLRDGIKNHTVDSILFPKDPVANAQRVISDLKTIFPPADGRFVLGPMIKLSWGTPAIITGELGILLELPAPIRLAILGKLKLALPPAEGVEVLILQMDLIGVLDFDRSDASIDATLVDSRLAVFPISGDIAMRLNWGASPVFALAAGGFHPGFQPPPRFPTLGRLAISLATGDNPRVRLEAYVAITASAAMTGARLEMYVERNFGDFIGNFSVSAYLGFDALVVFSPFSFVIEMGGGATLKRNGANLLALTLSIALTGPQPWHAWGEARFEFLGKHRIGFDVTVGEDALPVLKIEVSPLDELVKALLDPHAWSAQLPDERHMLATIKQIDPGEDEVLVHPLGSLSLRQRVVPLNLRLEKYGEANISGAQTYDFDVAFTGANGGMNRQPVKDNFSAGQYFELSDDEKLSRPAFESFPSGYHWISGAGVSAPLPITRAFGYETVIIDEKETFQSHAVLAPYLLHSKVEQAATRLGAAAHSAMRGSGGARFAGPPEQDSKVKVAEPAYQLVNKSDLKAVAGAGGASTYTEADLARKQRSDRQSVQVVGSHEVN